MQASVLRSGSLPLSSRACSHPENNRHVVFPVRNTKSATIEHGKFYWTPVRRCCKAERGMDAENQFGVAHKIRHDLLDFGKPSMACIKVISRNGEDNVHQIR
ncbi:MAG: hypothetical protein K9M17_08725 [Mariprofundaceae bacterium]|nr:hypothetical protein [Mariprofundaceae bacterium]